jgi:hypothetical protein
MADDWLQVSDECIDAKELMRRVRENLARHGLMTPLDGEDPGAVVQAAWQEVIGKTERGGMDEESCDIVPRAYVIDWRTPILGPLHALVRCVIHAEVRRYVLPALEKQSYLNRQMRLALQELAEENARLRRELEGRE